PTRRLSTRDINFPPTHESSHGWQRDQLGHTGPEQDALRGERRCAGHHRRLARFKSTAPVPGTAARPPGRERSRGAARAGPVTGTARSPFPGVRMSRTTRSDRRLVRIAGLLLGDGHPVAVLGGHDARWVSLPAAGGRPAGEVLARERSAWPGPLLAEPSSAADLPAIARHADGVVIGPAELRHPALRQEIARLGRPVVLRRGPGMPLAELLTLADRCAAEGCGGVVLCESRTGGPDLALLRDAKERSGRPVLAALGGDAALAGAAVAAGADGLL